MVKTAAGTKKKATRAHFLPLRRRFFVIKA